ncbi:ParB/RepB/Spo0J family partition protein [Brachybacterium sp. EF45031]|uniref:ParB/RepB/Spo0J family partition protein n=1 Tax=Brachybacterium sillae TaxID=2810536 RepID=UPI00217E0D37|nr:ParB/RepB/Spo0J family partition protein [Brachybacterium sillae]MCS6711854.1 ParB/RepB/Spo0J family partition protein [Brachybacterium sillae]
MTQKRGLGRGLGALIPGGSTPRATGPRETGAGPSEARTEGDGTGARNPAAARSTTGARSEEARDVVAGGGDTRAGADEPPLRTRTHPRTTPEPGEVGATGRPADMFFSGEPIRSVGEEGTETRRGAGRSASTDIAGDMARAAAERRSHKGRSSRRTAAGTAGAAESSTSTATGEDSTAESSGTRRGTSGKRTTGASKTSAGTKGSGRTTTSGATSLTTKSSGTKSSGTKTSGTKSSGTKTSGVTSSKAAKAATKRAPEEDESPAVEVEPVELTPARRPEATTTAGNPAEAPTEVPAEEPAVAESVEPVEGAGRETAVEPEADGASPDDSEGDTAADPEAPESDLVPVPGAEFAEIPIQEIRENPRNPRTVFDEEELEELAFSLREVGVLQPVVVRPIPATDAGESFELVMGERRWRAARRAGLASIPAIIRETSDDDLLRDALLENLHRSQLNALEEAAAYQQLLEDFGITQEELSSRIGRSRPQISNTLRLLRLPPLVQRRVSSGALTAGHARALLALDDPSLMEELAQRIVAEGLSVREVERLINRGTQPAARRTPARTTYNPRVVDITSRLSNRLEAPVRIDVGKRKGKITLEFTNLEDLERLVDRLGLAED